MMRSAWVRMGTAVAAAVLSLSTTMAAYPVQAAEAVTPTTRAVASRESTVALDIGTAPPAPQGMPDLAVTSVQQRVGYAYRIEVANKGLGPSPATKLVIKEHNGRQFGQFYPPSQYIVVDVPSLPKANSVPLYVKVPDFSPTVMDCVDGFHELVIDAIVDPWNAVAETNELNNVRAEPC
jgi:hypothetical protein